VCVVGHSLGGGIAMQLAYLFPERVERLVLVSSGGLGRELNPLLRAATLPGSEFVLPFLASGWVHDVGDSALRMWSRVGLPAVSPSSTEAWQSLATLADGDTRRAFLATSRSVIDAGGQTVGAPQPAGRAAVPRRIAGLGRAGPDDPLVARRGGARGIAAQPGCDAFPLGSLSTSGRAGRVRGGARRVRPRVGTGGRRPGGAGPPVPVGLTQPAPRFFATHSCATWAESCLSTRTLVSSSVSVAVSSLADTS